MILCIFRTITVVILILLAAPRGVRADDLSDFVETLERAHRAVLEGNYPIAKMGLESAEATSEFPQFLRARLLARLSLAESNLADARTEADAALALAPKVFGASSPEILATRMLRAQILFTARDPQAEEQLRSVLADAKKILGPRDLRVAQVLVQLAILYHQQRRDDLAKPVVQHAIGIYESQRESERATLQLAKIRRTLSEVLVASPISGK